MIKARGLARFYYATQYSIKGLKAAFRNEPAFEYEVYAFIVLFPASFFVAQSPTQWAMLAGSLFMVLAFELINSAIEAVVDRVGVEFHELAGRAKDLGSATVMMGLFIVAICWGSVIVENLMGG
jgi:diacylglycerol kinase (ATP)